MTSERPRPSRLQAPRLASRQTQSSSTTSRARALPATCAAASGAAGSLTAMATQPPVAARVDRRQLRTSSPTQEPLVGRPQRAMGVAEHLDHGLGEDQRVGEHRTALDVEEVVAELPRGADVRAGVTAAKRGPAGDPGLDEVAPGVVREPALERRRPSPGARAAGRRASCRREARSRAAAPRRGACAAAAGRPGSPDRRRRAAHCGPSRSASTRIVRSLRISNSRPYSPSRRCR